MPTASKTLRQWTNAGNDCFITLEAIWLASDEEITHEAFYVVTEVYSAEGDTLEKSITLLRNCPPEAYNSYLCLSRDGINDGTWDVEEDKDPRE